MRNCGLLAHVDDISYSNSMECNTSGVPSFHAAQSRWQRLQGWRVWVTVCASTVAVTFFANLALAIWASRFGYENGIATIQKGSCSRTKSLDLWLHLIINVLGTLLLGASNYTMQCLSSPTREEIDKAHLRQIPLDIGVPSLGNLRRISRTRLLLWWLLALSSLPLHFMYNSMVFYTISTYSYSVAIVSPEFLTGAPFGNQAYMKSLEGDSSPGRSLREDAYERLEYLQAHLPSLQNLDKEACLRAYRKDFITDRGDLLVVSSASSNTSLLRFWSAGYLDGPYSDECLPYAWACMSHAPEPVNIGHECDVRPEDWKIDGLPVEYCLSKPAEESCELHFSMAIVIAVLACNFIKVLCMGLVAWMPSSTPLLTLGDAIASFLSERDPTTANNCLVSRYRFQRRNSRPFLVSVRSDKARAKISSNVTSQYQQRGWDEAIRTRKAKSYFWFNAASRGRWLLCSLL